MADIDVSSLEPNSHKYKAEKEKNGNTTKKSREKIAPVINRDQIVSTKKPLSKKFAETFMTEDAKDVKKWLIGDVIIPGIKNTILDIISMAFFGETDVRRDRRSRRNRDDHTDYSSYYKGSSDRRNRNSRRRRDDDYYESDDSIDFRNIIVRNRGEAERIIESMRDRIRNSDSQSVSVAELLDMIDAPSRYTDNNYGWDDERDIGLRRVSSGFLIDVAEPKYLG